MDRFFMPAVPWGNRQAERGGQRAVVYDMLVGEYYDGIGEEMGAERKRLWAG